MSDRADHRYDAIINLPHPTSRRHPPMSMRDRAAQFAPFAALSGYHAVLAEAGRRTADRPVLSEDDREMLDRKLQILGAALTETPEISVTYFKSDSRKSGGALYTAEGRAVRLDSTRRKLCLQDGTEIPLADILALDGMIFTVLDND